MMANDGFINDIIKHIKQDNRAIAFILSAKLNVDDGIIPSLKRNNCNKSSVQNVIFLSRNVLTNVNSTIKKCYRCII